MVIQANSYFHCSSYFPITGAIAGANALFNTYFYFSGALDRFPPKNAPNKNHVFATNTISLGASLLNVFWAKSLYERCVSALVVSYSAYNLITISSSTPPGQDRRPAPFSMRSATASRRPVPIADAALEELHKGTLSISSSDAHNFPQAQAPIGGLTTVNCTNKRSYSITFYKGVAISIKPLGENGYDLFTEDVEAIVNAANTGMLGGGGVDGAFNDFNRNTGLSAERSNCKAHFGSRISTGGAFMTEAYNFSIAGLDVAPSRSSVSNMIITPGGTTPGTVKKLIHAIGPSGSTSDENDARLSLAYKNACLLAHRAGLKSIAFPVLSIGIFGYSVENAASAILRGIRVFIDENPDSPLKDIRVIGAFSQLKRSCEEPS